MRKQSFSNFLLKFCLIIVVSCAILLQNSQAAIDGGIGRIRVCNSNGDPDGLDYNPFYGGKDVEFVLSNPVCIAVVANAYITVKINIARMNAICGSGAVVPRLIPSPILDFIDISRGTYRAATTKNPSCAGQVAIASASFLGAIGVISAIYGVAIHVYNNTEICGASWVGPNNTQYINNAAKYKATVEDAIFGKNGYIDSLRANPNQASLLTLDNKIFREWYYGGVEVEDSSEDGTCLDVAAPRRSDGSFPPQKYYMKGLETGNFNCKKYDILPGTSLDRVLESGASIRDPSDTSKFITSQAIVYEFNAAYNSCKKRAREYVCIEYGSSSKFCRAGSLCTINSIVFSAKSVDNGRLACAETYSLCPYNFTIGGGAEKCDFFQDGVTVGGRFQVIDIASVTSKHCDGKSEIRNGDCTYNNQAGRCRNYCQFMTHCTKTDLSDYKYASSIKSPYFANACIDMVGDSQNVMSYGTGFIAGSARHFSAPLAQCTKETIENIFYNRAGHTECKTLNDSPSGNQCPGGAFYQKGSKVMATSFFSTLQSKMRLIVKLVLTLSITFYGAKILLGGGAIKKTDILMYILKIGLVLYFATGEAWQTMFFDGIYSASTVFSQMVFKVETSNDPRKRDGCQFGKIVLSDGTQVAQSSYPAGKEYLAIWDTLDCKITRYMGFGPEVSTANIVKLIIAGWLTGPIGIYFSIALLFFGLLLISVAIRALHIFLSSAIAIIIMVYVSPIIIPLVLFEKTKPIFKGWLTQIISFSLQPMILFAYIAVLITLMDKTLIGSATFYGEPPFRTISCKEYCQDASGAIVDNPNCDKSGQKLIMPKVDSIACMIDTNYFANWPGLELIGITLPFLIEFFADHVREKILTVAKAILVMYFLYTFMDEIPEIAEQLLGGARLPSSKANAVDMMKSIGGALSAIQKRANRGLGKVGKGAASGAASAARKVLEAGNQGKSVADTKKGEGADNSDTQTKKPDTPDK